MKTLRFLLVGLLSLGFVLTVFSQQRPGTLTGIVTDASTGETIPFAKVVIKNQSGAFIAGANTDLDGRYTIKPVVPAKYDVECSFVGYAVMRVTDIYISPNTITYQDFKLRENTAELAEIVVVYDAPLIDKNKTSTITSKEQTKTMAVRDVTSVASQAAGVTSDSQGNTNVRGGRSEGTVYFIDGVKVRGSVNIPQAAISQTEVVTGGLPAQYENYDGQDDFGFNSTTRNSFRPGSGGRKKKQQTTVPVPQQVAREAYAAINEIPFRNVTDRPLSTFSSDVDAASYSNFRRFITDGVLPPADAIRIEEMINYFQYNYPEPEEGEVFSMSTELGVCPWNENHQLLRIGLKTADLPDDELPDHNLVFLIDVSGSMISPDKLPLVQQSLKLLVQNLGENDRVAIVVYAGAAGEVLAPTRCSNKRKITNAIDNLRAGGSTAGGAGLRLAYELARKNFRKDADNRVILATDGDFNVGESSDEAMIKLIEKERETGIFLSVLGFGTGNLQDSKMEKIADHGNGNYAYIDDIMEAQKALVTELNASLTAVAKDTKFQIEFNPSQVQSYRLIGYENRVLRDEDFNDDTKDAGDVGSGHDVTAVYEIIPVGVEPKVGPGIDPLKYQTQTVVYDQHSDELATLKIRYKMPDEDESVLRTKVIPVDVNEETSPDFKFVCSIMELGMLMRNSEYKGNSSFEDALLLARAGKGEDEHGYKGEYIRLVQLTQALVEAQTVGSR